MKVIQDNPSEFNSYIRKGTPTFVFFYWKDCNPCKETKPIWKAMTDELNDGNNNAIIAMIEQDLLPQVKDRNGQPFSIDGFPTIMFIDSNGKQNMYDGQRDKDSFVNWVKQNSASLSKKQSKSSFQKTRRHHFSKKQKGGRRRRRSNKRTRRARATRRKRRF
jgi:hypothetical protein